MAKKRKPARSAAARKTERLPAQKDAGKKHAKATASQSRQTAFRPASPKPGFPVVGIGASAGGLEALDDLFRNLPPDTGMAYIVVTHQHPGHTSLLPELLSKETEISVVQAKDGAVLEPNHVYVSPPGAYVAVMDSTIQLMEPPAKEIPPLPIDFFFRSLALDLEERAICIVLSGTGSDGTIGLRDIKSHGGMAIVQEVKSARYAGMPVSAISTSLADCILPPAAMPSRLVAYVKGTNLVRPLPEPVEIPREMERPLQKIFVLLRTRLGHDFSSYKLSTLRRRIERRMNAHQISRPEQYALSPVAPVKKEGISTVVEKLLLSRFAPPSVVVDSRGDIVYVHGRTGSYFEPASGQPRLNVFDMSREGLKTFLASAVRSALSRNKEVVHERVRIRSNEGYEYVNISVSPIQDPEPVRGLLLVTFSQAPQHGKEQPIRATVGPAVPVPHKTDLERDLQFTRESLRTTVAELDTSNEELKSTNEELQSTNEEMQSANEELETSKEELQSLNEELTTVNTELQRRVEELSQTNDDMQNLLNGTDIATIFLDNDLKIKRYTDKAVKIVKLIPTDVGRPVGDLASNIEYDGFERDARQVLATLNFKETEVFSKDNTCYQMRIMPYRTARNVIDGLVVTFVDVNRVKQAETAGREARELFESIFSSMREPMIVLDENLHLVQANSSWYGLFQTSSKLCDGKPIFELMGDSWSSPAARQWLERTVSSGGPLTKNLDLSVEVPLAGHLRFHVVARRVESGGKGRPARALLLMEKAGEKS